MAKKQKNIRLWFQAAWFAVTNGYAKGFLEGKIYKGQIKYVCVPGLSCYSCPGALGSCPIGSLQAVLDSGKFRVSCYVFGFLLLFGALLGRFVCGWLCPFGLVQDLLHKIPLFRKKKNMPGHRVLKYLRYVILVMFVILLPMTVVGITGMGDPWFCKYICPSGTLLGGLPLLASNPTLRSANMYVRWERFTVSLIQLHCTAFRWMKQNVSIAVNVKVSAEWIFRFGKSRTALTVFAAATVNLPVRPEQSSPLSISCGSNHTVVSNSQA